ncbi:MAG: hypothetical protein IJ872_05990 [Eubacterium sp.]|nr:hypothetical protein [Eubacterium sp.]
MKINEIKDDLKIEYPLWRMLNSSFFNTHSSALLVKDGVVQYVAFFTDNMWFILDWGVDTGDMMLDLWTISFVALTDKGTYKRFSEVILSEMFMLDVIDKYVRSAHKMINGEYAISGISYDSNTFYNWLTDAGYEFVELQK